MNNSIKKLIAILSAATLLCSSAAAYASQIPLAPVEGIVAGQASQPVTISLPGLGIYGTNVKMQYSIQKNSGFDIAKMEYSIQIDVQKNNPNTTPSGWFSIASQDYQTFNDIYIIWAKNLSNFEPEYDKLRATLNVRVTLASGEVIVVTDITNLN